MNKPDFMTMPRVQLRQYILDHREDDEAFQTYLSALKLVHISR
ncbi:DUF6887 family protein [Nostoc favosum]|nr:hypothetical protein [Nostoc favosum]